ncbi:nuclear transport factor 2 family protein [Lysobacter enzymogenes]|uniref:nuclear transport factor 2 family protein n=1 Tax=Lysobacter enzymogenes TaxID=69 RepID=UPI001AF4A2A9|nr:nuclear transport factor 2 family protein [Lysobacter enzymogenes]QQQ02970.1 nuclear transport factor 2 family protein [Lysobacter enzymogenes]
MSAPALPSPVAEFVAAVNRGDAAAALAFFGRDGVVDDWGTRYVGAAAIAQWSAREFVGARGRLTPTRVGRDGGRIVVDAGWRSDFYSGDSRFVFTVDGARIREMRIVGH